MPKNTFLCVHGHFYQPPRENPWIEAIEYQESAAPFHDWNERIHYECYLPNARARVLDNAQKVVGIENNYAKMSFNFGPTLMDWLDRQQPSTLQAIVDADKASVKKHQGHGNAIAQVYNHIILPLANERDKITQIRWGVADFRFRFEREPESIWLPETACNEATLEALVEEKIKFIILEPHQAQAVRPLGSQDAWRDVGNGDIDPRIPYRCFLKKDPSRSIDIFFYDGPISKALGFEDLLFDAKNLMDRISGAADSNSDEPQLINVATDGETYGHHKPFADRVLAYALNVEAPARGFKIANYGEFLAQFPPKQEVTIKEGENGEGTAWSCAHGVRRWKDNCGCRGMGPAEWTQEWRKPLRESLDWLRDRLAALYEEEGGKLLKDVWQTRNDYAAVLLNRNEKTVQEFFGRHSKKELTRDETTLCLKLLEIQRHAMLMFTSCGWFFTELSGIETVQILQYAARAIQLAREVSPALEGLEKEFLDRLSQAKSNIGEFGDGREIYRRFVTPSVISASKAAAQYAILSIADETKESFGIRCFQIDDPSPRAVSTGHMTLGMGKVKVTSKVTLEENELVYIVLRFGQYDFRCSVRPQADFENLKAVEESLFKAVAAESVVELLRKIDEAFGTDYYSLKDLLVDQRKKLVAQLSRQTLGMISSSYERIYDENRGIAEIYNSLRLPVPPEIRFATEYALSHQLLAAVRKMAENRFAGDDFAPALRILELAKTSKVKIQMEAVTEFLSQTLEEKTRELQKKLDGSILSEYHNVLSLSKKLGLQLDTRSFQESVFAMLRGAAKLDPETRGQLFEVSRALDINPAKFEEKAPAAAPQPIPA